MINKVIIGPATLKVIKMELLKRNLLKSSNSTVVQPDFIGFLLGKEVDVESKPKTVNFDRFDCGIKEKNGLNLSMPIDGDLIIHAVNSSPTSAITQCNFDILLNVPL